MPIGDMAVATALNAPDALKPGIRGFAGGGLNLLNWWRSKPEICDCPGSAGAATFASVISLASYGAQAGWGAYTTPALKYGNLSYSYWLQSTLQWVEGPGVYFTFGAKRIK